MKILVTGRAIVQQPDRCTGQQLAEGFREAGHDALFYGCFFMQPYNFLGAKECQEVSDWDLVIVTEMNDGYPGYEPLFNYYKLQDVPRLYWDFDVSYHPEVNYKRASSIEYDGYLVANKHFLGEEEFGRFGKPVLHLPYACSPKIHRRMPEVSKEVALGFIGSATEERERLIEAAKKHAANMADIHRADGVFGDALVEQTNKYFAMFHNNQDACKGLVPGRPWETTGCGTTLLMDRTSYDDFIEFLPEDLHNELFVYDDDSDVLKWVNKYAGWERSNTTLTLAGESLMNYVHASHSYKNRAETIIKWCHEQGILHN